MRPQCVNPLVPIYLPWPQPSWWGLCRCFSLRCFRQHSRVGGRQNTHANSTDVHRFVDNQEFHRYIRGKRSKSLTERLWWGELATEQHWKKPFIFLIKFSNWWEQPIKNTNPNKLWMLRSASVLFLTRIKIKGDITTSYSFLIASNFRDLKGKRRRRKQELWPSRRVI